MEDDCIFCRIIRGEIPATVVYEDDNVIAFKDVQPIAPIHDLVVPKTHVKNLMEVEDSSMLDNLLKGVKEVAKVEGLEEKGFRVITNIGEDAGQAVLHLHIHVLGGTKLPTR